MNYTMKYNHQTEGLFIIDSHEFIRFSIVIAKENAAAAFDIVTEILSDIDNRVEDNNIFLSVELIACLYPAQYKKLEPLLLNPETTGDIERIIQSLRNRDEKIDSILPFLFSIDKEWFIEFEEQMITRCTTFLANRIKMIEKTRMFDEVEVIKRCVNQKLQKI